MKKLITYCCVVVLVALLAGCRSASSLPSPSTAETSTKEVKVVVRDTFFKTEKDSSFYKAYIDCVNGKPVLKNPKATPGKNLKAPKVNLKGNELQVDCQQQAQKLFYQWKEQYVKENQSKTIKIPYAVPAQFTQFQVVQLVLGKIFLFLILLLIVAAILRYKKFI